MSKRIIPEEYLTNENIEKIAFGICAFMTSICSVGLSIISSLFCGLQYEMIKFCVCFLPIRIMHEGYHCKKFIHCVILTNFTFLMMAYLLKFKLNINELLFILLILCYLNYLLSKERNKHFFIFYSFIILLCRMLSIDLMPFLLSLLLHLILVIGGKFYEK